MNRLLLITTLIISTFIIYSCSEESVSLQNDEAIVNYISSNNLVAQKTDRGLYYIVIEYGSVDTSRVDSIPNANSFMQAHLTGSLLSEEIFYDTNEDDPILIDLSSITLIDGLKTGMQFFTRGGHGILLVPAQLAYTSAGLEQIDIHVPPDVPIRFDVQLLDFYTSEDAYNDTIINSYLLNNRIVADTTTGGTIIKYSRLGSGTEYPNTADQITIRYKASLLDGTEVYNSLESSTPDTLLLSDQFEGFQNGLSLCPAGTTAILLIPSQEALGSRSTDTIPPYSQWRYDVIVESIL